VISTGYGVVSGQVIGTTLFAGAPYPMPKFSVILPTRDTVGDFEEMCSTAGAASAERIHDIKPAASTVAQTSTEARRNLRAELADD